MHTADLICNVLPCHNFFVINVRLAPEMEKIAFLSPFAYANASEILSGGETAAGAAALGAAVLILGLGTACVKYVGKDLG